MTLLNMLKTIFLFTIILYVAPFFMESIKKQYIALLEPQTPVGVISISEPLHNAYYPLQQLHSFFKDPAIKGIVIKINCSDTASGTSQTIFHDIRQLKKEYPKPIIALVENICLSGAYLIATACDSIIAPESALIGNIGTTFNASLTKQIAAENSSITESLEHDAYQHLTKQIAVSRKLSLTTIHNWADGKIFTGTQAVAVGLINEVGALCTVIKLIKEKALIEGEIEWIEPHHQQNLLNLFFSNERTVPQCLKI